MLAHVTTAKKSAVKTSAPKKAAKAGARTKSLLMEIGEEAMRKALLAALEKQNWSLTDTAASLRMAGPSLVIRSIHSLGLDTEYEDAKRRGLIRPGTRTS